MRGTPDTLVANVGEAAGPSNDVLDRPAIVALRAAASVPMPDVPVVSVESGGIILLAAMAVDQILRLKPQNLLDGLPLVSRECVN
jgi:hypothetical protein